MFKELANINTSTKNVLSMITEQVILLTYSSRSMQFMLTLASQPMQFAYDIITKSPSCLRCLLKLIHRSVLHVVHLSEIHAKRQLAIRANSYEKISASVNVT